MAVNVEFRGRWAVLAHVSIDIVVEIGRALHTVHGGCVVESCADWPCGLLLECLRLCYIVIRVVIVSDPQPVSEIGISRYFGWACHSVSFVVRATHTCIVGKQEVLSRCSACNTSVIECIGSLKCA